MLLTHWGVRGSFPTPGPQTLRYGGHTSCLDVTNAAGQRCIIDAGTGLLELGARLRAAGQTGGEHHILLSHCHWDHIQGLPFFAPVLDPTATLVIHGLQASTTELSDIIAGATRREFFPRDLGELRATFRFHAVEPGQPFAIPGFAVMPVRLNHPLGAVGYRLDADIGRIVATGCIGRRRGLLDGKRVNNGDQDDGNDDRCPHDAFGGVLLGHADYLNPQKI